MGQLYSKLNSLVMNDVDTASDPDRPREKLETEFTSPARVRLLPDPRSPTDIVDRTPIVAPSISTSSSNGTPVTAKPRPRYLETDMDNVLGVKPVTPRVLCLREPPTSTPERLLRPRAETSTPIPPNVLTPAEAACEIVDSIIEEALMQASEPRFSDTGHCEVVTTELSGQSLPTGDVSSCNEVIIEADDVEEISSIIGESIENSDSMATNWSGIGGPDRSLGSFRELSPISVPDYSALQNLLDFDDSRPKSDSLVVHSDSLSLVDASPGGLEWDSDFDGGLQSPKMGLLMKKNSLNTPLIITKNGTPRTPLGDVSKNSPLVTPNKSTPTPLTFTGKFDGKIWKNVRDERIKLGMDAENTPPHSRFSSYPPNVVQSAPGKMRTKTNKANARWANDSLVV